MAVLENMELAFEHGVPDEVQTLYRIVFWGRATSKTRRMTRYFADKEQYLADLERIGPENVIVAQEFAANP